MMHQAEETLTAAHFFDGDIVLANGTLQKEHAHRGAAGSKNSQGSSGNESRWTNY